MAQTQKKIDIGAVVRASGLPASTLRFYEEQGLIKSTGRKGLRRLYEPEVLEQLSLIALGSYAGFSLSEIAAMFSPDGRVRIDRKQLKRKADDLDATIKKLVALQKGLRHAAECPAPNHLACPKFQRLIRVAGENRRKAGTQYGRTNARRNLQSRDLR